MRTNVAPSSLLLRVLAVGLWLGMASQATAQTARPLDQEPDIVQQKQVRQPAASVADSPVGEIGQRQKRDETIGIKPTARIISRISNRVQSRIRNRIDRDYDPAANTVTPFDIAEDQARITTKAR